MRTEEYIAYLEKNNIDVSPDRLGISEDIQVELKDVFKQLHIKLDCCKARLLGQVEYNEYY
jgi:hypothetical protein